MRIADSRRLTGGNLQSANPCAVAEVRFTAGDDVERMLARWREELRVTSERRVVILRGSAVRNTRTRARRR